ncbi:hypothetical protein GCM10009789_82530 [Kribbella sancticallisti]|uniref:Uncharacterized protein n=1 Tax=Kribbella sancticallisti TaxID=460087 RepID=A0ABN2ETH3_9ACTN
MSRKDILYVDPSSNLIVSTKFSSSSEEQGTFVFEEEYREPANSYTVWLMSNAVPALDEYLEGRLGWSPAGDPAERLVHCLEELIARGELSPAGGRSALREQVFTWCEEAGLSPKRGGVNRREVVLARGMVTIEVTVDSTSRKVIFQEVHGPLDQRAGLYQIQLGHSTVEAVTALLEERSAKPVPEPDGDWQERLLKAFRAVADLLAPGERPMEARDRVAGWLAAAGIPFQSYGSEWQTTLLKVHRRRNDCVFSLRVTLDPERGDEGIRFTEFYDYLPLADDPGREYGYTVHAPYDALPRLVDFLEESTGSNPAGSLQTRLIDCFAALIAEGELGDGLPLRENHLRVAGWFEAAGVPADTETWSWINSE